MTAAAPQPLIALLLPHDAEVGACFDRHTSNNARRRYMPLLEKLDHGC
jgi:hypothetical protein